MSDEVVTPAEGATVQNAEGADSTATTTAATAVNEQTTPATEPSQVATEPDIATLVSNKDLRQKLLQDAEFRKEFYSHPETQKEFEHRVASESGRRAKAQLEAWQAQQQAEKEKADLQRALGMDETELGIERKQEIERQLQQRVLQEQIEPLRHQTTVEVLSKTGAEIFATARELAQEFGLDEKDLAKVDAHNYPDLPSYLKDLTKLLATTEGKKLAKEMAKVEARALREAEIAQEREKSPAPAVLAPAEPGMSEADFTAAYANGQNNDTAQQIRWMQAHGIL